MPTAIAPSTTPAALARTSLASTARVSDHRPWAASTTRLAPNTASGADEQATPRPHGEPDEPDGERPDGDVDDGVALGQPWIGQHVGGSVTGVDAREEATHEVTTDPAQGAGSAVRQHQQGVEQQHRRHRGRRIRRATRPADGGGGGHACSPYGRAQPRAGPGGQSAVIRHGSQPPERWYKA